MNQIFKTVIAGIAAVAGFTLAHGTEAQPQTQEQQANSLCQKAMTLYAQEMAKNKNMAAQTADVMRQQCVHNVQPPEHWQCVIDGMNEGSSFIYATSQCNRH